MLPENAPHRIPTAFRTAPFLSEEATHVLAETETLQALKRKLFASVSADTDKIAASYNQFVYKYYADQIKKTGFRGTFFSPDGSGINSLTPANSELNFYIPDPLW